jgi:hypothetical protein
MFLKKGIARESERVYFYTIPIKEDRAMQGCNLSAFIGNRDGGLE